MAQDLENVSRETMDRLRIYSELLKKWNPKINLVSRSSLSELWSRHIVDSHQIFDLAPESATHWLDLGSGGGFPGMVVAILAQEAKSPQKVTLVESDTRKCVFLRTVARETGVEVTVLNERIEKLPPLEADVVSARALADLDQLLNYVSLHMKPAGRAILPKGKTWEKELKSAQLKWNFDFRVVRSKTEVGSVILNIEGVSSE